MVAAACVVRYLFFSWTPFHRISIRPTPCF
jgi:hypothetical protein